MVLRFPGAPILTLTRLFRLCLDRIDGDSLEAMSSPRCAAAGGFNLHANVSIGARDRERLQRLLRYAARPAFTSPDSTEFWPAAKWRPLIIPTPIVEPDILSSAGPLPAPESGEGSEASIPEEATPNRPHSRRNYTWARLMMRVFQLDVLQCNCGGRLRILASIHPPDTTRKILDCLGLPSRAPPLSPAVSEAPLDYS